MTVPCFPLKKIGVYKQQILCNSREVQNFRMSHNCIEIYEIFVEIFVQTWDNILLNIYKFIYMSKSPAIKSTCVDDTGSLKIVFSI